jgi:hypothetical protein
MYGYIMEKWATPGIRTTVLVSPEFYKLCKERHIRFSEALRVGMAIILAERGEIDYDNNLNISRKVNLLTQKISEVSQELNDLKIKHGEI